MLAIRRLSGLDACTAAESSADIARARIPAPFLFEAGPLPEASAGPLRRFAPEWVVFIDAAALDQAPGTIGWIDPQDAASATPGAHAYPLSAFAEYLTAELGCRTAFLGIQPEAMDFDTPVSVAVKRAVDEIVREIEWILSEG